MGDLVERFTARLVAWSLLNGRGMGKTTRQSINQLKDKVPPPVAAYAVYRAKGENAPNGGIMRCAPVAIARRRHPELLVRDTADTCAVSHYAPASQWSCVVVNAAIAVLLGGGVPDMQKLLAAARADGCPDLVGVAQAAGVPTSLLENAMRGRSSPGDAKWMRGNRGPNGHTVLTMQAGLWGRDHPPELRGGAGGGGEFGWRHGHQRRAGRCGSRCSLRSRSNSTALGQPRLPAGTTGGSGGPAGPIVMSCGFTFKVLPGAPQRQIPVSAGCRSLAGGPLSLGRLRPYPQPSRRVDSGVCSLRKIFFS